MKYETDGAGLRGLTRSSKTLAQPSPNTKPPNSRKSPVTAQLAVNAATAVNPVLKPAADELKTAITSTNTAEDAFLNATQIGEVMGMSARAVNNWLVQSGLQYRTEDKKIPYRPTESGKQWGRIVPALARSSNQTVFQLRWLPEIVQVISQ